MRRREFIRGVAVSWAVLAVGGLSSIVGATPSADRDLPALARGGRFTHGVASGHAGPRSVRLWTRVDGLARSRTVVLDVARDAGFGRTVEHRRVVAHHRHRYTVDASVGGLDPGERYFYRFSTRRRSSRVGQFETLARAAGRER